MMNHQHNSTNCVQYTHLKISQIQGFMLSNEPLVTTMKNMKLHLQRLFVVRMGLTFTLGNAGHLTAQSVLKHSKLLQSIHTSKPWIALVIQWSSTFSNCRNWACQAHVGTLNHYYKY